MKLWSTIKRKINYSIVFWTHTLNIFQVTLHIGVPKLSMFFKQCVIGAFLHPNCFNKALTEWRLPMWKTALERFQNYIYYNTGMFIRRCFCPTSLWDWWRHSLEASSSEYEVPSGVRVLSREVLFPQVLEFLPGDARLAL